MVITVENNVLPAIFHFYQNHHTVNDANYSFKKSNSQKILDSSDFCAHKNDISTTPIV